MHHVNVHVHVVQLQTAAAPSQKNIAFRKASRNTDQGAIGVSSCLALPELDNLSARKRKQGPVVLPASFPGFARKKAFRMLDQASV